MKKTISEKIELYPDILRLLTNLERQIGEQNGRIQKMEDKAARIEKNFRILLKELADAGYVNVPERRKLLKRSIIDHEALTNLLKKKGVINKSEFHKEIKLLVQRRDKS